METIEIPGVGTGYLLGGEVVMRTTEGGLLTKPVEVLTADYLVDNALYLATEEEAVALAGDPGDTHEDKGDEHMEDPPPEGGN